MSGYEERIVAALLDDRDWYVGAFDGDTLGETCEKIAAIAGRAHTIPEYAMLDIWIALGGASGDYGLWRNERTYADAWSQLMAAVAGNITTLLADTNPLAGETLLTLARERSSRWWNVRALVFAALEAENEQLREHALRMLRIAQRAPDSVQSEASRAWIAEAEDYLLKRNI